jgi:hypothetical protein
MKQWCITIRCYSLTYGSCGGERSLRCRVTCTHKINEYPFHWQNIELKVVENNHLPSFSKAVIDSANTMRDHGKSVMYLELHR